MERALIEYMANALWQIPLLAAGGWLLLRTAKPGPLVQHGLWLAVLALAVLLPMRGIWEMSATAAAGQDTEEVSARVAEQDAGMQVSATSRYSLAEAEAMPSTLPVDESSYRLHLPLLVRNIRLSTMVAHGLTALCLAVALFGLARIGLGWRGTRELVRDSRPMTLSPQNMEELQGYGKRLRVKVPQLRESSEVATPAIVGAVDPVLLLPAGFEEYSAEEIRAAVVHELAHVRRHDYLVNLMCQVVALPVAWHPATGAVQRRIGRTREMVCDAIAAQEMCSEAGYARCLMTLAKSMLRGNELAEEAQALGLFSKNTLEERVMRLMEKKSVLNLRAKVARVVCGVTGMAASVVVATVLHVTPIMAAEPQGQTLDAQNAPAQAQPTAPVGPQAPMATVEANKPPAGKKADHVRHVQCTDGDGMIIASDEQREPTTEERARIAKEMADARRQISEATAKFRSGEFQHQIEEAKRQAASAQAMVNSAELKKQIQDAQAEGARVNSEEFKRQMAEVQKQLQSPEFKKQIEEAARQGSQAALRSDEFRREMEKAMQALKDAAEELKKQHVQ